MTNETNESNATLDNEENNYQEEVTLDDGTKFQSVVDENNTLKVIVPEGMTEEESTKFKNKVNDYLGTIGAQKRKQQQLNLELERQSRLSRELEERLENLNEKEKNLRKIELEEEGRNAKKKENNYAKSYEKNLFEELGVDSWSDVTDIKDTDFGKYSLAEKMVTARLTNEIYRNNIEEQNRHQSMTSIDNSINGEGYDYDAVRKFAKINNIPYNANAFKWYKLDNPKQKTPITKSFNSVINSGVDSVSFIAESAAVPRKKEISFQEEKSNMMFELSKKL